MMDMIMGRVEVGMLGYMLLMSMEASLKSGVMGTSFKSSIRWV
jgi:hypothetical protein